MNRPRKGALRAMALIISRGGRAASAQALGDPENQAFSFVQKIGLTEPPILWAHG